MEPNKKKKLIDLTVIEEFLESGVSAVALVEEPAIEVDFYAFKKEQFVTPNAGETQDEFIGRCIGVLVGNEGYEQDQAAAICYSYWDGKYAEECPLATQDIALNLKNRQNAIDTAHYGPLDPNLPNEDYWKAKAAMFEDDLEVAKKALCGNCSFFNVGKAIEDCIASGIGTEGGDPYEVINAGKLGYCEAFDFKCAASRTCDAWVVGGPVTMGKGDKVSFDYHDTIDTPAGKELAKKEIESGSEVFIISAYNDTASFKPLADELGIPMDHVYATGSNTAKVALVNKLGITRHYDNNLDVISELGNVGQQFEVVVNAPAYIDQTGESNKKKKPILETRPVLMEEETLLAYFSQVGISMNEYNMKFANADLIPWQEGDIMPADGAGGRTYYKYVGPPAQRDFCRQMLALDRLYTFEEIDTASGFAVNPGFGERGAATYDIWNYKGGPNCKHRWQKFYAKPDGEIVNKGPAVGKAGTPMYDQKNHGYLMSKMFFEETEDQRILVGPAMIPGLEIPRYDKKNKEVFYVTFSEEAVAKVMEKFMREQSVWNTNQDHDGSKPADTYIFESWLIEDPETDKAKTVYGYEGLPKGTWMCKMRVVSDDVWKRVKNGELKGFSVEGDFVTEEQLSEWEAEKELMEQIKKIVS